ncbi:MAG: hypothetical protein Q4B50_06370 [Bacillota bacterium]|nr:hypothetical protein [Bacillota bacterium]
MKHSKLLLLSLTLLMLLMFSACAEELSAEEVNAWWEGDWYGWWTLFDGDGSYSEYLDSSWDCCVRIKPFEGKHLISVWDEDFNSYEDECLAEVIVEIDPSSGGGSYGLATSVSDERNFFWNSSLDAGDWSIDPAYAGVDNMLIIEGSFTDVEGDYCEYGLVLTKWGFEWNEADSTAPPTMYYDYFLPLIESGAEIPLILE